MVKETKRNITANNMKSAPKLIRRFTGILLISSLLLILLNFAVFIIVQYTQTSSGSPYSTADEIGKSLVKTQTGYTLDSSFLTELSAEDIWAVCIDNDSHQVVWHTDYLPAEIPMSYTLSDISSLTLGYVADYPTYTGEADGGLVVLGYPKLRYWKMMWPTWDYSFIAHLPQTLLWALLCNILLILLIYITVTGKLISSINPIVKAIQLLSAKQPVHLKEKGLLSELAFHINHTGEILERQKRELQKKETARANWIAGVSHDIRTPLSMVMGHADQLKNDGTLSDAQHKKASVIVSQSERIKDLVNDLNLASKLEYNMQPMHSSDINIVALVRCVVVDFLNADLDGKWPVTWDTPDTLTSCLLQGDDDLLKRAINNLLLNCRNHNEDGCAIHVSVQKKDTNCIISVEDEGIGISIEEINQLNHSPHYMVCDDNVSEQRHGLGLLIVKQITASHCGKFEVTTNSYGGFTARILLPMENIEK